MTVMLGYTAFPAAICSERTVQRCWKCREQRRNGEEHCASERWAGAKGSLQTGYTIAPPVMTDQFATDHPCVLRLGPPTYGGKSFRAEACEQ